MIIRTHRGEDGGKEKVEEAMAAAQVGGVVSSSDLSSRDHIDGRESIACLSTRY